jgi:hypothetical protein
MAMKLVTKMVVGPWCEKSIAQAICSEKSRRQLSPLAESRLGKTHGDGDEQDVQPRVAGGGEEGRPPSRVLADGDGRLEQLLGDERRASRGRGRVELCIGALDDPSHLSVWNDFLATQIGCRS